MKTLIFFILILFLSEFVSEQTVQSFSYETVAQGNSIKVLTNQSVNFTISMLSRSGAGTASYSERRTGKTNNTFGLVEMEISKGSPFSGTFSIFEWESNSYFIKIELDMASGSAYQVLNTSQLMSILYALRTNTIQTGDNWGADYVQTDATLTGNVTTSRPPGLVGILTVNETLSLLANDLSIFAGNTVTLPMNADNIWLEEGENIQLQLILQNKLIDELKT